MVIAHASGPDNADSHLRHTLRPFLKLSALEDDRISLQNAQTVTAVSERITALCPLIKEDSQNTA
jgi:hypothetical protein